jgi:2-hydroxychromene-2-carboxylate isomerase
MASDVSFFIDFSSPFTYLALQRVPQIAKQYGRAVSYVPVDLARLKILTGNTAPPTRAMPVKLKYMRLEQQRWARRYGVPIAVPAGYDPTLLNRGTFYALDRGRAEAYAAFAFHRIWGLGGSMIDQELLADVARHCRWEPAEFIAFMKSPASAERLERSTIAAHERGVFGVPTMIADGEMWWGNDRLDFFEQHLSEHGPSAG